MVLEDRCIVARRAAGVGFIHMADINLSHMKDEPLSHRA